MLLFNVVHFFGLVCEIPAFKYKTVNLRSRTLARKENCVKVRREAQADLNGVITMAAMAQHIAEVLCCDQSSVYPLIILHSHGNQSWPIDR